MFFTYLHLYASLVKQSEPTRRWQSTDKRQLFQALMPVYCASVCLWHWNRRRRNIRHDMRLFPNHWPSDGDSKGHMCRFSLTKDRDAELWWSTDKKLSLIRPLQTYSVSSRLRRKRIFFQDNGYDIHKDADNDDTAAAAATSPSSSNSNSKSFIASCTNTYRREPIQLSI